MLLKLFIVLIIAWPASEVILSLFLRAKRDSSTARDRGSQALLWAAIAVGLTAALFISTAGVGKMRATPAVFLSVGSAVIACGLILRWTAILTLGRFFTSNVAIVSGHAIVRTGVYRYLRHPAYSGLLLAFLGTGVSFGNWLSLVALIVPIMAALLYRVRVEETALADRFGHEYVEYCRVTKRLIPGIF